MYMQNMNNVVIILYDLNVIFLSFLCQERYLQCSNMSKGEQMKGIKWLDRHFEEILLVLLLFVMMIIMGIQIFCQIRPGQIHFRGQRRSRDSALYGPVF